LDLLQASGEQGGVVSEYGRGEREGVCLLQLAHLRRNVQVNVNIAVYLGRVRPPPSNQLPAGLKLAPRQHGIATRVCRGVRTAKVSWLLRNNRRSAAKKPEEVPGKTKVLKADFQLFAGAPDPPNGDEAKQIRNC